MPDHRKRARNRVSARWGTSVIAAANPHPDRFRRDAGKMARADTIVKRPIPLLEF